MSLVRRLSCCNGGASICRFISAGNETNNWILWTHFSIFTVIGSLVDRTLTLMRKKQVLKYRDRHHTTSPIVIIVNEHVLAGKIKNGVG